MDVPTRWNSTYEMLEDALPLKDAFFRLDLIDRNYEHNPSEEEWEIAMVVCEFLKIFYDATCHFSGSSFPTSNVFFPEVCKIQLQLDKWGTSDHEFLRLMAKPMSQKFSKYWEESCLALAIAVVLDPRYKMAVVEYYYEKIYGIIESFSYVDKVRTTFSELFDDYNSGSCSSLEGISDGCSSSSGHSILGSSKQQSFDGFHEWYAKAHDSSISAYNKSEMVQYLEERVFPNSDDFNILHWWQVNSAKFPTLASMARDILAVPATIVASEAAFSVGGRVIGETRASLLPDIVEALMTCNDWIESRNKRIVIRHAYSSTVKHGSAITAPIGKECADLWLRIANAANVIVFSFLLGLEVQLWEYFVESAYVCQWPGFHLASNFGSDSDLSYLCIMCCEYCDEIRDEDRSLSSVYAQRISSVSGYLSESLIVQKAFSSDYKMATLADNNEFPTENNELALAETQEPNNNIEEETPQPNKRRKKKSVVWEHFTIENVGDGCRRACCKQCKQSFAYSTGSKVAGTSHLKRHIAKGSCPVVLRNQGNVQGNVPMTPHSAPTKMSEIWNDVNNTPKRRYRTAGPQHIGFDADRCRHEIARMIIMHDYPLHMVEHPGFVAFVQNLQPRFDMILNVVMEPYPDSDSAFGHAVSACLSDWSMEGRLFSLTINQPLSEAGIGNLRSLLSIKNPLMLNGQLLVGSCLARTLSSIAVEALKTAHETVRKIRDSVKYVRTSESHEDKFNELKQRLQVPTMKTLALDDQTRWNTSYEMLVSASELKEVFSCLDASDSGYIEPPSVEVWKQVEILCTYLKLLFDSATILTGTTISTTNVFFHEVWKIQLELARGVQSDDPFISNLTKPMQEKFDKYWKDCCLVLAIAVVMDPRFKMKLVEFSFTKIYGDEASNYVRLVDEGIHELFNEYLAVSLPLPLTPTYMEEANGGIVKHEEAQARTLLSHDELGLTDFDMYIMETTSQQSRSELDQYLEESLLPRVHEFDVLGWWKLNKNKYPTLSKMARDILTIPVCTLGPDSVFDTTRKEMDSYRCSLRPETVEALICAKDWLKCEPVEMSNALWVTAFGWESNRRLLGSVKLGSTIFYAMEPFKLDIDELINEFAKNKMTNLADMKRIWLSRKFSFIFEASPSTNLAFFMQSLYAHSIGYMISTASLSHRLGGLYCLYCLYEVQPFKPPFKIYLSIGELKRLRSVVVEAKEESIKVVSALVKKMLEKNMFLFGFVDLNDGSVTQRVNELTDMQNARVQVAYKTLFAKTRIEEFMHMDLGNELDVDVIKKLSTDYAAAKELAIQEASNLVDLQNIKHIAEKKKLIGEVVEKTAQDWMVQKELLYQQTGLDPHNKGAPQLPRDDENIERQKDDVNFGQEGSEHSEEPEFHGFLELMEDDDKFGEELERQILFGEGLDE
ncbi:hypothetical protein Vadar_010936 [Vaccinium darrowii]|uniref:Uncharacterized protein n=1 Tax=Vaccinium darrowii TaxID=229202 RepID=A0ACB7Z3F7_9ERIC|nr:hypothetical protein Vadar_010936 [Vaccinium darrowii]